MKAQDNAHDEKMKNIAQQHDKEIAKIINEFELEKKMLQILVMPIKTNFMNMMNFQLFNEKQNYQNQNYNYTLCPNMNIGIMSNQFNQFNNMTNQNYIMNYNMTQNPYQLMNSNINNSNQIYYANSNQLNFSNFGYRYNCNLLESNNY